MPQNSRTRVWGTRFDHLPSSPPSSPPALQNPTTQSMPDASTIDPVPRKKDEKLSHDASLFVGNLPSHLSAEPLRQQLKEFHSGYPAIVDINVASGSQGFFAFAQCESEAAAAALLHTLTATSQEPFHGRMLRYEPTHAHRAIHVSYKAPSGRASEPQDLPFAMKLLSSPHFKVTILYDEQAIEPIPQEDPNTVVTLFSRMEYTAETIQRLATHFGPLESFALYQGPISASGQDNDALLTRFDGTKSYPPPHDSPRLPQMDPRCWEIKFKYREDYLSCLHAFELIYFTSVTRARSDRPLKFHHRPDVTRPFYPITRGQVSSSSNNVHPDGDTSSQSSVLVGNGANGGRDTSGLSNLPSEDGQSVDHLDWSMDVPSLKSTYAVSIPEDPERQGLGTEEVDRHSTPRAHMTALTASLQQGVKASQEGFSMGFASSPVTPQTPNFPSTPPNAEPIHGHIPVWHANNEESYYGHRYYREFDKTSLYIPEIPVHGSDAWSEEKLREYFTCFGVVRSTKIIKPASSRHEFAFVSFDNTEAAARAIAGQDRFRRVQYRDINHPRRGAWRGRSRGHGVPGAYRRPGYFRRPAEELPFQPQFPRFDDARPQVVDPILPKFDSLSIAVSDGIGADVDQNVDVSQSPLRDLHEQREPTVSPSRARVSPLDGSSNSPLGNREGTAEGSAPVHSSLLSSTSAPRTIATLPGGQSHPGSYFPGSPWSMQHISSPMNYGMYYPSYPGCMLPGPSIPPGAPQSDVPSTPASYYWPAMYGAYVPYPTYMQRTGDISHPTHPLARPPVPALGHFQDDHRGLIPCYPRDALTQYMSQYRNSEDTINQGTDEDAGHPSPNQAALTSNVQPRYTSQWQPFIPMNSYGYPPVPHIVGVQPRLPGQPWMVSAGAIPPSHYPTFGADSYAHKRCYPGHDGDLSANHHRHGYRRPSPAYGKPLKSTPDTVGSGLINVHDISI